MKQNERKIPRRQEPTDEQLLEMYHGLPVELQRHYFNEVLEASKSTLKIKPFDPVLADPAFMEEVQRLARAVGIPPLDFSLAVNPLRYSSFVARSEACTVGKLTSIDYSRFTEVSETIVYVHAYKEVEFTHTMVPDEFHVHVLRGEMEIEMDGSSHTVGRSSAIIIEGGPVTLRLRPGCWITYVDHPLTAHIRARAEQAGQQ